MPFSIDLQTMQKTKQWTFKQTVEARQLQALLDKGDRKGYIERLRQLNDSHKFTRTQGQVYELSDEGETIHVPIKFQVKKSVITWSFIAPFDRTHQSFRDEVFNTAAKAHACVANSCETYYRGTDHLHLKEMHSYPEEAFFNHNHYRTADGGPITPVEVYEHLFGFYAQQEGRKFIPLAQERDKIILTFAVYWANFNADIRYVAFSFLRGEGEKEQVLRQLKEIACIGRLTPDQADKEIDAFFNSEHGKNMLVLAESQGFPRIERIKKFIKSNYREMHKQYAPAIEQEIAANTSMESVAASSTHASPSTSSRSSPGMNISQVLIKPLMRLTGSSMKPSHAISPSTAKVSGKNYCRIWILSIFAKDSCFIMPCVLLRKAQHLIQRKKACGFIRIF
ncbi:hypothetical protein [Legionella erythra]|uniref:Uncharacterized protein n=1 Tax=Legionella erythra TaxID=448 RepID=A0A0W0TRH0_LEGER|nr:hypothetical protein [Legionella erythra]KTC98175.1 hypothetical protein Lery_1229 [Legionella erythra]